MDNYEYFKLRQQEKKINFILRYLSDYRPKPNDDEGWENEYKAVEFVEWLNVVEEVLTEVSQEINDKLINQMLA